MTFSRALIYFLREATANLIRSWKVSSLAILTITVSLFLAAGFLLVSANLDQLVETLRSEGRITLYVVENASQADFDDLAERARARDWVVDVEQITAEAAAIRFARAFPSLEDLLEGENSAGLPRSVEVRPNWSFVQKNPISVSEWVSEMEAHPSVELVDADRDWLSRLELLVTLVRGAGVVLGVVLLTTSMFTISSVIRLMAHLYREEISVMRLVGATEFFIRGPFYAEGWIQGFLGGCFALVALFITHFAVTENFAEVALVGLAVPNFLSSLQSCLVPFLGGAAGLAGAIISLHKEELGDGGGEED